jgi:two-component system, sensor histidine kinase and response regulator
MLPRLIFLFWTSVWLTGQVSAQIAITDSLRQRLPRLRPDTVRVSVLANLCQRFSANDLPTALAYGLEARKLAEKIKSRRQLAEVYNSLGTVYNLQGNYPEALRHYLAGLALAENMNHPVLVATLYNNIGNVHRFEGGPDEALPYYRKALKMREKLKDRKGIASSLNNIAAMYDLKGQYDSSLFFYAKSLKIKEELKDRRAIATSMHNIGVTFYRKKQYDSCLVYQEKALALIENDKNLTANVYLVRTDVYTECHQIEKAIQEGEMGLLLARQTSAMNQSAAFHEKLSKLYAQTGDFAKAYENLAAYQARKDSLDDGDNIRKMERLKLSHTLQKKDMENQTLLKDKQLRIAENTVLGREKELQRKELLLSEANLQRQESENFVQKIRYETDLERKNRENTELLKDRQMRQTELRLKEIKIEQQYAWQAVFGVLLLSLIILAAILYGNNRRRRIDNAKLNQQKEEILTQNKAINTQNARLTELNTLKDKLFSIITHDFRSPLHALQGILSLLRMEALTPEETRYLTTELSDKLGVTLHMLENMLHWAKNQMDGIQVKTETFDLCMLANENIQLVKSQADKKQILLRNELAPPVLVCADSDMLNIVIRNLMTNAVKFTSAGNSVTLLAEDKGTFINFSVADTGMGITEENLQKLFSPGTTFTTLGTSRERGTGLGLLLCKDFVERNGGALRVKSEWGKGSVFTFSVPKNSQA